MLMSEPLVLENGNFKSANRIFFLNFFLFGILQVKTIFISHNKNLDRKSTKLNQNLPRKMISSSSEMRSCSTKSQKPRELASNTSSPSIFDNDDIICAVKIVN